MQKHPNFQIHDDDLRVAKNISEFFAPLRDHSHRGASDSQKQISPRGNYTMLHRKMKFLPAVALALFLSTMLASSASAKGRDAGGPKSDFTSTVNVLDPLTLGGTSLKPGTYTVKATDSEVTLVQNGKEVAHVSVQWKDSTSKAQNSALTADSGVIKEIHFGGKTRYAVIE